MSTTDLVSRIYPGAIIHLTGKDKISEKAVIPVVVKRFGYDRGYGDGPHISVNDDNDMLHRLEFREGGIIARVYDDKYKVTLMSEPLECLQKALAMLPTREIFYDVMSFMIKELEPFSKPKFFTIEEFTKEINHNMKVFEYFLSEDPCDFLVNKIRSSESITFSRM